MRSEFDSRIPLKIFARVRLCPSKAQSKFCAEVGVPSTAHFVHNLLASGNSKILTPEQKQKLTQGIIEYFETERNEKLGVIAATELLELLV